MTNDLISRNIQNFTLTQIYDSGVEEGYRIARQERTQGNCGECDFRKFSERMIDVFVDVMNKYGISSVEELEKRVRGENR